MSWQVEYTKKALKQLEKLPDTVSDTVLALVMDIEEGDPVRGDWPNFSKLNNASYHCHLKKGRPTYVACWRLIDKKTKQG